MYIGPNESIRCDTNHPAFLAIRLAVARICTN